MAGVFDSEIEELIEEAEKRNDRAKIKLALSNGKREEAYILFKYSSLTDDEFEKIEVLIESRVEMKDWATGKENPGQ